MTTEHDAPPRDAATTELAALPPPSPPVRIETAAARVVTHAIQGASAGAIIGSMLLPGIGSLLGAALGAFLGSKVAKVVDSGIDGERQDRNDRL